MLSISVRLFARSFPLALLLFAAGLTGGCASKDSDNAGTMGTAPTGSPTAPIFVDMLRKGDLVTIVFSGNPSPPTDQEERIKEDGTVNLQFIGPVHAEGKTSGQLQKEIQDLYVPKFFRRLTVTVKTENRVFFIDGEVRSPGRLFYTGEITVLKAVASAGGFTDFAARGRVELVRSTGEKVVIDGRKAKDNPRLDPAVIPGDRIYVPRRSAFGR